MSYRCSSVEIGLRNMRCSSAGRTTVKKQEKRAQTPKRWGPEPQANQHISDAHERERRGKDTKSELASGLPQRFGNRRSNALLERGEPRPNHGDGATDRACWITQERKNPSQPFHVPAPAGS
jgi:hypothetical protein